MSSRWLGALVLAVSLSSPAIAADPDTIYAPGITARQAQIPILSATDAGTNSTDHFQVTADPTIVTRAPNATGALADSANQHVGLGYHLPVLSMFTVGYDTGVNAFRQDQTIFDDQEATSQVTTSLAQKASLQVQTGPTLKTTGYVQTQRSFTDGIPGYTDATKYGAESAWAPLKDVTTFKVAASTQQTYNLDRSILEENVYTASLDQKLPYIPVTLHTAGSITDDTSTTLLSPADKDGTVLDASVLWKIVDGASTSVGYQRQDAVLISAATLQSADIYFTQMAIQPSDFWTVTMRAAHESKDTLTAGHFISTSSDVLLSLGLTWKVNSRFTAGAGIDYRALQSQTPVPAAPIPPATISLSAGGNF